MQIIKPVLISFLSLLLCACEQSKKEEAKKAPIALVSVAKVLAQSIEVTEDAIGSLEGLIDPTASAEISARVDKVLVSVGETVKKGQTVAILDSTDFKLQRLEAQAEVARVEVLLANQQRTVERNQTLVDKNFISKNVLDDVSAQRNALKEQLQAAKIRVATIANNSSKTRVVAPADGKVEKRIVNAGEFVRPGDPIIQVIGNQKLRAHIPFPEHIASKIKAGQTVKLTTPTSKDTVITTIKEIKPLIMADSRAVDVIADINNQPDWQAGASVNAQVILSQKDNVLVVPEQSVVLRPAGEVVYVINNHQAQQRIVKTGERKAGLVEVLSGLDAGLGVAVDGASYLTDGAKVKISTEANTGK